MAQPIDLATAYRGKRVLVLGASGFIGRWVARALTALEADLHVAIRDREQVQPVLEQYEVQATQHVNPLAAPQDVTVLIAQVRPMLTINLAGYGVHPHQRDERTARWVNDQMVGVLANELAESPVPDWSGSTLVHAGSGLEYGVQVASLHESAPTQPQGVYATTKAAGTGRLAQAAQERSLAALTARLFTVYGPGERAGRLLPSLLEAARTHQPLDLTAGMQRRDFTYVEDVAEGLLRLGCTRAPWGEVVNLATGQTALVREFAQCAGEVLGIPEEHLRFGKRASREHDMTHAEVPLDRLRHLTGWQPATAIAAGIRRTHQFCCQQPAERD
jgi:nucleoside-diphosphate-sugar epimerase